MREIRRTRRKWLQAAVAAGMGLALGCDSGGGAWGRRVSTGTKRLNVFNWSDYIHEDAIAQFEEQMGATVVYDNYASDSELETRLATGAGNYDVVFPSDRAMVALLAKDLLLPLDRSRLTNFGNLDGEFLGLPFDKGNEHSVPYFWGSLAVGVRGDLCPVDAQGLEVLFDEKLRRRITMLDDMENVVAAALSHLRHPLNSVEPGHLHAAQDLLLAQKPLVQAYTSDSYRERLISGDAWAALGWSGDLLQADAELQTLGREEARVRVIVPPTGTMLWIDSMVIPRRAQNVELALAFINHLLDARAAAINAEKVSYATPNRAARALLPAQMLADERIYPPTEVVQRCTWLKNRGAEIEKVEHVWRVVRA
jgi:spermidine/putrescine transport system substrate-binding protein